jgi:hypothetical protein
MKKLYFFLIITMIASAASIIFKTAKPQAAEIMKPSVFAQPDEIGAVVYRRFYAPLESQKVVIFGVPPQPPWHQKVLLGFLKVAQAEKRPYDAIIMQPEMPPLDVSGLQRADGSPIDVVQAPMNDTAQAQLLDAIRSRRQAGQRVLVYTPSVFSTHLLPANPLQRLEKQTGEHFFSITTGPLVLQPVQEFLIDPPCVGSERDQNGTAPLGCAFLQSSRGTYRKHVAQDQYVAIMNQQGVDDYLLMISYPGQDKDAKEGAYEFRMNAPKAPLAPGE